MKQWYRSKTVWINVLTLATMIIGTVTQWPEMKDLAPQLAYALAIINVALRFISSEKIG